VTPQIFIQTSLHMVATSPFTPFISINVFTFMSFNMIPVCILANKCSAVAKMGDRSATIDEPKIGGGGCAPFWVWGAGSYVTECGLGRCLPSYQVASRSIQPFGNNRHGPKIGGLCPHLGTGAGSPSNTMSLGPRPTSLPSGILILPAVWPQQIWAENWGRTVPLWGRRNWVTI